MMLTYCLVVCACVIVVVYGGPKGSNTKQFTKTQNNLPKHKTIYQITNQFTKTQNNLPNHKSISQKHKSVYQNTNQFPESQIKRLGTCSMIIREILEETHSQDFPRPIWRLLYHVSRRSRLGYCIKFLHPRG